ncbi:zinc-binding dehydrogenase [Streptomyces sp. NPDC127068]|uniref:zinc-binding dehydrogenase n=1 Tax=Streptomyces sp. NPDC127068 TaxID=3347127 RepID=UPI00366641B5
MRAVVLRQFGPPENLRLETVPDPVPGPGQVRIAVRAAGVHQIETAMREGLPIGPPLPELPAVFGGEVAGVVESVGSGVDPTWVGARVVTAHSSPGGYAELTVADVAALHRIPDGLGHEAAVAMVVTGTTTVGLLDAAALTSEDVLVVTSAAGGVGYLALQFARRIGTTVIGAAGGPAKTATVRELGVDLAVDYERPDWPDVVREALGDRVTVVLDGVEGEKGRAAFGLLVKGGRYLSIGASSREEFRPDEAELRERGVSFTDALALMLEGGRDARTDQARALAAAADGTVTPSFHTFPLSQAGAAHAAIAARATTGKVVLVPDGV